MADKQKRDETLEKANKLVCFFCERKILPDYKDYKTLRNFLTDRAKIVGKERSGVCSKHQRYLTREIKRARHLALLPFTPVHF